MKDDAVDAVLEVLTDAEALPYPPAPVRDYIPEGRAGTREEIEALKAADRDQDAKNREFAERIVRTVREAGAG